jgi:antitoxin HicB
MGFGYRYVLERQENGWWLVRFPGIPEALTEGETQDEARANAVDCVIAALEGYMKAGKPLPRDGASHAGQDRAVLPSLVTAKLAVYETMRKRGWSKLKLAKQLGMPENSVRRLLDLRHSSHMWVIDEALAKMNAELPIDLPKARAWERSVRPGRAATVRTLKRGAKSCRSASVLRRGKPAAPLPEARRERPPVRACGSLFSSRRARRSRRSCRLRPAPGDRE